MCLYAMFYINLYIHENMIRNHYKRPYKRFEYQTGQTIPVNLKALKTS